MRIAPSLMLLSSVALAACGREQAAEQAQADANAVVEAEDVFVEANHTDIPANGAAEIYARLGPSVARVDYVGELYNGEKEEGSGSGFFVSRSGLLLTCKHVVPEAANYKTVTLQVRPGSKLAVPLNAEVAWVSPTLDLALLRVQGDIPPPVPLHDQEIAPGNRVIVLGFPLSLNLNINDGLISGIADDGRLIMQTPINRGNSGGPVFTENGRAVGVAWGAALKWRLGQEIIDVEGVKFFIGMAKAVKDIPAAFLSEIVGPPPPPPPPPRPPSPDNWLGSGEGENASDGPALDAFEPETISRAETVRFLKDDHPVVAAPHRRRYEQVVKATQGFEIVDTDLAVMSSNHAGTPRVVIAPDRKSATVSAELTSGPAFDRWRGWLVTTVELKQRAIEAEP